MPLPTDSPELQAQSQFFGKASDIAFDIATRFALRERDNELTNFEGIATEGYNRFLSERANDPNPSSYLAKYGEFVKTIPLDSFSDPETKRIAQSWLTRKGGVWGRQVLSMAQRRSEQNTKDAIALAEFRSIQQRDPDNVNRAVTRGVQNGVISEDEGSLIIEKTHYDILLGTIEDEAWEIIQNERAKGTEVGLALSRGLAAIEEHRGEVKNVSDLNQISTKVERSFLWSLTGEIAREEQNRKENREKGAELIEKPETTYPDIEALNLDDEEKEKVRKARDATIKKGPAVTEAETYNELVGEVLNYYSDPTTLGQTEDKMLDAFYGRALSNDDRKKLADYLSRPPYPANVVTALKEAYQYGAKNIWTWKRGLGHPKTKERIAAYNRAMFDWLGQQTDMEKGLYPSVEDVFVQSRILANFYKTSTDEKFAEYQAGTKEAPKETPKAYKYTATNPTTGERVGSNDGIKWEPLP